MKNGCLKKIGTSFLLTPALLLTTLPATAQYSRQDNRNYQNNRDYQRQSYYNGMRDGGRGGNYDRNEREQYRDNGYDGYYRNNRNYNHGDYREQHDGGIGPGKGALIGGAGGAVLGALFGGSMKGAIIGGAAGAGVGAIAGKAAQDKREDNRYRDNY